jgi:hypothetical protein
MFVIGSTHVCFCAKVTVAAVLSFTRSIGTRTYPLLRTVRKCNRQSETYQTLEDYGELWLKMFGASVVYGGNFGVHEWPLRKWRFFGFRAPLVYDSTHTESAL